jgi:hypothetical protein
MRGRVASAATARVVGMTVTTREMTSTPSNGLAPSAARSQATTDDVRRRIFRSTLSEWERDGKARTV